MIALNDYLYDGDTVVKILHRYSSDLKTSALASGNGIDLAHSNCLLQMIELLEHNDFLAGQSQQIREFYKYLADRYPFLAFTFKGRIKSLIRLEEKINGNIVEYIHRYYSQTGEFPPEPEIKKQITRIKDLVESVILYNAIFENDKTIIYNSDLLKDARNKFSEVYSEHEGLEDIVYAYDVSDLNLWLYNDMKNEHIICFKAE